MSAGPELDVVTPELVRARARRTVRRVAAAAATLVILGLAGFGVWYAWRQLGAAPAEAIPTFRIEPGTVQVVAYASGSVAGGSPDRLLAPSVGSDILHISALLPAGTPVQPGEVVVRFYAGAEQFALAQQQNAVAVAQAKIDGARAQARAQQITDGYALRHAQNQVQLAEIEVRQNSLAPALTAQENNLSLRSARAELGQLESDAAQRKATSQGLIAVQQAAAAQAEAKAAAARTHMAAMTLRADRAGYVALEPNLGGTGVVYSGMTPEPFHVGDLAQSGQLVAEIPDLEHMVVNAQLGEADSAYVAVGQAATLQVAGVPGRVFAARVQRVAGIRQASFFSANESETCVLSLQAPGSAIRPGVDAQARIVLAALQHVLWVPAEAVFRNNGKPFLYVRRAGQFIPQTIRVLRQGSERVAIAGVPAGTVVALTDPRAPATGGQS
ncbi:MAG: efflux RND transporter periplasmic adaptor subunit [Terriglobales bacterium]